MIFFLLHNLPYISYGLSFTVIEKEINFNKRDNQVKYVVIFFILPDEQSHHTKEREVSL